MTIKGRLMHKLELHGKLTCLLITHETSKVCRVTSGKTEQFWRWRKFKMSSVATITKGKNRGCR